MYDFTRLTVRGRHEAIGIRLLSHTAANGWQPNKVLKTTSALTATEMVMDAHMIQTMPLLSCRRRRESSTLVYKNAIAKPLTSTAELVNLRVVVICAD